MQSKISTTQLELFNDSPLDETSLFHDPGRPGFFSIFVRPAMADPRWRRLRGAQAGRHGLAAITPGGSDRPAAVSRIYRWT